jgi:hypothetical protein
VKTFRFESKYGRLLKFQQVVTLKTKMFGPFNFETSTIPGASSSKVAELQKYVKSQKRATRNTKKRKIVDQSVPLTPGTSSETTLGLLESTSKLNDDKKSA